MGYRVKPFTMAVRDNSTQQFIDVGLLGSDVDREIDDLQLKTAGDPINVLSLGVKNDGSEDASTIVNEALLSHSLYFPIGIYRFDSTINANHNIIGAGYTREYRGDLDSTVFSFTDDSAVNIRVESSETSVVLKNFNIVRTWEATSNSISHTSERRTIIENIGIFNSGGGNAIYVNPGTSVSRNTYIRNISVIGDFDRGLNIQYSPDCLITDCEFMRCKIGIELIYSGYSHISNIHAWSVPLTTSKKTNAYWTATRGFVFRNNSDCTCDGLYSDSCYIDVAAINSRVVIDSLRSWVDSSYDNTATDFNGQLAYIDSSSKIIINSLITKISNLKRNGLSDGRPGLCINKTICYSETDYLGRNTSYPISNRSMYNVEASTNNYQAVAVLRHRYGGSCKLTIQYDTSQVVIEENPVNTYTKTVTRGSGFSVYRKTVTGADGYNNIVFYVPKNNYYVTIENYQKSINYGLVDYDGIYDSNRSKIALPSQTDTTGLVEIT